MVPKSIEVPVRVTMRPRYIGFLVYRNTPFVTMTFARAPGFGFVPNLRNNIPLPTPRKTPATINIIPLYLQG